MADEVVKQQPPSRERRATAAVSDLPDQYMNDNTRSRGPSERRSRYLAALRDRLNYLVRLENEQGDAQIAASHKRLERNALIFALRALAPIKEAKPAGLAQPDGDGGIRFIWFLPEPPKGKMYLYAHESAPQPEEDPAP